MADCICEHLASEASPGKTAGFSGGMAQTGVRHGSNRREAWLKQA